MTTATSFQNLQGTFSPAVAAAGTTQATATTLPADHCMVTTVAASSGVILNPANGGSIQTVANGQATNALNVYPPVGSAINGYTVNLPLVLPPNRGAFFIFVSPTAIISVY